MEGRRTCLKALAVGQASKKLPRVCERFAALHFPPTSAPAIDARV